MIVAAFPSSFLPAAPCDANHAAKRALADVVPYRFAQHIQLAQLTLRQAALVNPFG